MHNVSLMDVWSDESYLACGVPKLSPSVNLIHPFEEDVAFFVVKDKIFSVDIGKKKVLGCGVYSSLIRCDFPFVISTWPISISPLFRKLLNLLCAFICFE